MKNITLIAALAAVTLSANAQSAFKKTGITDNLSVSLQGGVYEPLYKGDFIKDMRPVVRLSVNKYFNPVMGVSLYGEAFINNNNGNGYTATACGNGGPGLKTIVDFSNVGGNALVNLTNLFAGYQGQPRFFEVAAEAGLGWGYQYGHCYNPNYFETTNFALDLNFNVMPKLQVNLRPAISYQAPREFWRLDRKDAVMQLTAGVSYTIGDNFTFCDKKYTQGEIDALNGQINGLRGEVDNANRKAGDVQRALDNANRRISELEKELAAEKAKDKTVVTQVVKGKLAPVVIFDQGKSSVSKVQQPSVQMIATYMKNHPDCKVTVKGYASPEGSAELNQKLSQKRADSVRDCLIKVYKISADRVKAEGLGATSEVFPENDWNRVATFIEE